MNQKDIAIIGGGPAGIVAARYLKSEGFSPVVFEQGTSVGGQWSGEASHSGVWPMMRTNTSRIMTSFSDLAHASSSTYPTNQAMGEYLRRYAEHATVAETIRTRSPVQNLRRDGNVWVVKTAATEQRFERVVIASGRYQKPDIPPVPGLQSFSGSGGLAHAFAYKQPESYRGLKVLVAGCSISSLEIASDLAMLGAARVVATHRRQRYVLPKLINGVPTDHAAFTRFSALAEESFPPHAVAAGLKRFVLDSSGSPEQFGAPKPSDNIFEAGITQSQFFLPLVAEGRIQVKPWMSGVQGRTVHFADGSSEEFDAILFGTGYALSLPFLSEEIRRTLNLDAQHLDLHKFTFHPELEGLAFLGQYQLVGPYFPVLELQARWVAYCMSGALVAPTPEELQAGIEASRAARAGPPSMPMHAAALLFSRAAGVEPDLKRHPALLKALLFGPLTPTSFRLSGRDSLAEAPTRFAEETKCFGCMPSSELAPAQVEQLKALAGACRDKALANSLAALLPS